MIEKTYIMIKPDAVANRHIGEIVNRIERSGLTIERMVLEMVTPEQAEANYAEHKGKPFFEGLLEFMSSGPVVAIIVEGQRVVEGMRVLMGSTDPTTAPAGTIRGDLGRAWNSPHMENLIHGSDSVDNATREISLWFPEIY